MTVTNRCVALFGAASLLLAGACSEDPAQRATDAGQADAGQADARGDQGPQTDTAPDSGTTVVDKGAAADQGGPTKPALCPSPLPTSWIFCEDFESSTALAQVFFEYNDTKGAFSRVATQGASGTHAMEASWQKGQVGAGWVSVAFGKNPIVGTNKPHYRKTETFNEIYWRLRVKHQAGWPDVGPAKLCRATAFAKSNWGQAMIAHLWSGKNLTLMGDPASCVSGSTVNCNTYNDFANLKWIGQLPGKTQIFAKADSGNWRCVEGHVKLNSLGKKDGVFRFWIDGALENSRSDLDWRGSWSSYGLNLLSVENYWNSGATANLKRWIDDIAVATTRIGCN
jgi:hypothetical protein